MAGPRMHMSNNYKTLKYLEGSPVQLVSGITSFWRPEETIILKDYPDTVLIQMKYKRSHWGLNLPSRYVRQLVPKASLAVGDVKLKTMDGQPLYGEGITSYISSADADFKWSDDEDLMFGNIWLETLA